MPNFVKNHITFFGDDKQIQAVKDYVMSDRSDFDFNKIIPMPEELNLESGSITKKAIECALVRRDGGAVGQKDFEKMADLGEKYLSNKEKYGAETWYEWCPLHWGTKWEAWNPLWHEDCVSFETAWSAPDGIYKKLTQLFPDVRFEVNYADEDLGNNCGTFYYDGETLNHTVEDDFDFAYEVWWTKSCRRKGHV